MSKSASSAGTPRHRSIDALLTAFPGETDPKELIRRLARKKVSTAKAKGWSGPPYCPKEFASLFGIRCKEVSHDIGGDGRILLHGDGTIWIEFQRGRIQERQRFTIFHEFAHTLFPDYCEYLPHHQTVSSDTMALAEREFEALCDLAAAEMLLPFDDFSRDLDALSAVRIEVINDLRVRYQASIDATVMRFVSVMKKMPCAAMFLTDQRGKFAAPGPLWVRNSCPGKKFGFVWPGTMPPEGSVVIRCYGNDIDITDPALETWLVKDELKKWIVQAAKLPVVENGQSHAKVVALIQPAS